MRLRQSIYNNYLEHNGEFVIYNSLSGQMAKLSSGVDHFRNGNMEALDKTLVSRLIEYGFVTDLEDEVKKADLYNLDRMFDRKLRLTILPTEKCNFRCKYCYESHQGEDMSEEVQRNLIRWLEKNLYQYGGLEVSWFGGEPLMALDTITSLSERMIRICHGQKIPYGASVTTNGFFLTEDVVRKLLKPRSSNISVKFSRKILGDWRMLNGSVSVTRYSHLACDFFLSHR